MKKVFLPFLLLFTMLSASAQDVPPLGSDFWINRGGFYGSTWYDYELKRFSQADIEEARRKIDSVDDSQLYGGAIWSGPDELLIVDRLRLLPNGSYVRIRVYTCASAVRDLDYGTYEKQADNFILKSERRDADGRRAPVKFIGVSWGDRRYFVNEKSLPFFAAKAAGVLPAPAVDAVPDPWFDFWVEYGEETTDDMPKGLPRYPKGYETLARKPIVARITKFIGRRFEDEFPMSTFDGGIFSRGSAYLDSVEIDAGRRDGVINGVRFTVLGTGDILQITKTAERTAVGYVVRNGDKNSKLCWSKLKHKAIRCGLPRRGTVVKTDVGDLRLGFF